MPDSKIYFIADAHLGAGDDSRLRERQLCALLDKARQDASAIIFLGDMFDFWFTYRYVVPKGHVRLIGKMAELADAGIQLHYFIGNHDMWVFRYFEEEMDITMHDEPAILQLDGKKFLIGHGDGLGNQDHRYNLIRKIFRCRLNQRMFAILPEWMTFGIAYHWSGHSRKSHLKKDPTIFEYQGDDKEGIVIHCRKQLDQEPFDYCIFGHRHTAIVRTITSPNGRTATYVNAGDWLANRDYAVYEDGQIRLASWPRE